MPSALRPAKNCSGRAMPQKATTGPAICGISMRRRSRQMGPVQPQCAKFGFELGICLPGWRERLPASPRSMVREDFRRGEDDRANPRDSRAGCRCRDRAGGAEIRRRGCGPAGRSSVLAVQFHFGELAGIVAFSGDVDRNAASRAISSGSSPNSSAVPSGLTRAGSRLCAAIAARKYIDMEAARGEQAGQGDGRVAFCLSRRWRDCRC